VARAPPPPPPATTRYSTSVTPTGTSQLVVPVVVPDKVYLLITYEPSIFSVHVKPPPETQVLAYPDGGVVVENPVKEE
jgi:hypothetical protein